mmetsp:Transcript_49485/g.124116  ORF Transcript_49485/g.124116 Transcript_49485/m.124116 type:complete len:272 (-) Transcript_49485:96-911(-)
MATAVATAAGMVNAADRLVIDPLEVAPGAHVLDGSVVAPDARLLRWPDTQHRRQLGAALELKAIRTRVKSLCVVLEDALGVTYFEAERACEVHRVAVEHLALLGVLVHCAVRAIGLDRAIHDPPRVLALAEAPAAVLRQPIARGAGIRGRDRHRHQACLAKKSRVLVLGSAVFNEVSVLVLGAHIALHRVTLISAVVVWHVAKRLEALVRRLVIHKAGGAVRVSLLANPTLVRSCEGHTSRQKSQTTRDRTTLHHHHHLVVRGQKQGDRKI